MPILGTQASQISGHLLTPNNFESISTTTLSSTASDVTFSSIPGTYKHLQIRVMASAVSGNQDGLMQFNGDTGTNYSYHFLYGSGAGSGSAGAATTQSYMLMSNNFYTTGTSLCGVAVIDILDYTNTNKYKTMRSLAGADLNGSGSMNLCSGNWRNTNAITSITIYPNSGNFNTYSSFALYGVK
jgi:hypothetical protein